MTYATRSDWSYDQWCDMMSWKQVGYQGLDRNACPLQWKGIMEHVEQRMGNVTLVKASEMVVDPKIYQAVSLYGDEGVQWYPDFMATPVGGDYPPVAPWS
jgi:hypothetical protein